MRVLRAFAIALITGIAATALVWHAAGRQLFTSIGNLRNGSQLIPVAVPAAPREENEQWSIWIVATEYRDLTPVNESDRMAARYRVRLLE